MGIFSSLFEKGKNTDSKKNERSENNYKLREKLQNNIDEKWKQQLLEIEKVEERNGQWLNCPASDEQIELLKKEVKEKFNHVLPEQYINFLKVVNGIEFNGYIFYGADSTLSKIESSQSITGYIDSNEIWYENEEQKQYMFFGDSDISWYCFDLSKGAYVELDNPSGTLMYTYNDFIEMLEKALEDSLQ